MKAYCLIRTQPHYRHEAFVAGLKRCGYDVHLSYARWPVRPGDVLVIWNRYGETERIADGFEAAGGTVLVAENGYIGRAGVSPKDTNGPGNHYYAIARHAHNGRGRWSSYGPERWSGLGIELKPWRTDGDHVLVCANRSFGMQGNIMPPDWGDEVARRLRALTKRRIVVRQHPGNYAAKAPLADDLKNAWACVVWSSSCGVHALAAGIPVVCEARWWICKSAALQALPPEPWPDDPDRAEAWDSLRRIALERLAWAQWTVDEIASGEAFRYLLSDTRKSQSAAVV